MESPDNDKVHAPGLTFIKVVLLRPSSASSEGTMSWRACQPYPSTIFTCGRYRVQEASKCFAAKKNSGMPSAWSIPKSSLVDIGFNAAPITIASLNNVVVIAPQAFAQHNLNPAAQKLVPLAEEFPVDIGLVYAGNRPLPVVQKFIDVALAMRDRSLWPRSLPKLIEHRARRPPGRWPRTAAGRCVSRSSGPRPPRCRRAAVRAGRSPRKSHRAPWRGSGRTRSGRTP